MKKLSSKKSLRLQQETVRVMSRSDLELANGGWYVMTQYVSCTSICTGLCGVGEPQ